MINNHSIEAVERLGAMCAVSIFPSFFYAIPNGILVGVTKWHNGKMYKTNTRIILICENVSIRYGLAIDSPMVNPSKNSCFFQTFFRNHMLHSSYTVDSAVDQ